MSLKISVVTICYNSAGTINKTIESIRNQKYKNIEYILVDGGSTDGTIDIIKNNSDVITKWISEKDNGISDAFNKGIKMSTGDYVVLVNSDDELTPNCIDYVVDNIDTDSDIVHGNIIHRRIDGRFSIAKPSTDYDLILHKYFCVFHPGMFIRKTAYDKYGLYNIDFKCAMDRELVARMYSQGAKIQYLDHELAVFTEGGASTRYLITHTIPEDVKISRFYGSSYFSIYSYNIKHCTIILLYVAYNKLKLFLRKKD